MDVVIDKIFLDLHESILMDPKLHVRFLNCLPVWSPYLRSLRISFAPILEATNGLYKRCGFP